MPLRQQIYSRTKRIRNGSGCLTDNSGVSMLLLLIVNASFILSTITKKPGLKHYSSCGSL